MQYDLDIENVNTIRRKLHFKLAQSEVSTELDRAFQDLTRKVRLPGFRPGKVPRKLLEARFGKQIQGEVSNRLIDRVWRLASETMDVAGSPSLEEAGDVLSTQPFTFTIAVDVKPEVEIADYKNLDVEYSARSVTDEQVDSAIRARLARQSRIQEVSGRAVEEGDEVLTEVKLVRKAAAPAEDQEEGAEAPQDEVLGEEAGTKINTSGDRWYPGLEKVLIGMETGEEKTATITIGARSQFEHLRNQEVEATVKILGIQARTTPELNDETAGELGFEGGAEGMKAAIRMELDQAAQEEARQQARVALLEKLAEANDFEVPAAMVEEQLDALREELKVRRAYAGEDPRSIRFSDAELADLRNRARFAAKGALILAAIARQEAIEATDEDVDNKINEIATNRQQAPAAIRGYLEREDAIPILKARILEEKTLEWLLESADLKLVEPGAKPSESAAQAEPAEASEPEPAPAKRKSRSKAKKAEEAAEVEDRSVDEAPSEDADSSEGTEE